MVRYFSTQVIEFMLLVLLTPIFVFGEDPPQQPLGRISVTDMRPKWNDRSGLGYDSFSLLSTRFLWWCHNI